MPNQLGKDRNYVCLSSEERIRRAVSDMRHLDRLPLELRREAERRIEERSERWRQSELADRAAESSRRLGNSAPTVGSKFFSKETRAAAETEVMRNHDSAPGCINSDGDTAAR